MSFKKPAELYIKAALFQAVLKNNLNYTDIIFALYAVYLHMCKHFFQKHCYTHFPNIIK